MLLLTFISNEELFDFLFETNLIFCFVVVMVCRSVLVVDRRSSRERHPRRRRLTQQTIVVIINQKKKTFDSSLSFFLSIHLSVTFVATHRCSS